MKFPSRYFKSFISLFLLTVLYIFFSPGIARGEDIGWFEKRALSFDRELKILKLQLKNTLIAIEKKNLEKTFTISAGLKDTGMSYSFENGATGATINITTTPSVSMDLPSPYETSLQFSLPFSYSLGGTASGGNSLDFSPSVSVNQPLNRLIGLEEDSTYDDLSDRYIAEQAKVKIAEREYDIRLNLYKSLKDIFQSEENVKDLDVQIAEAKKTVEDTIKLGNYDMNSSNFVTLKDTVRRLERNREIALATLKNQRNMLARLIGSDFDSLPWGMLSRSDDWEKLGDEIVSNADWNSDYYLAGIALLRDRAKLEKDRAAKIPSISAQLSMKNNKTAGRNTTDLSGGFQGILDNITVSASLGGTLDPGSLYAYFGFTWALPDRRSENLDTRNDENIARIDAIQLEMARENYENNIESLRLKMKDLESRKAQLEDDTGLAKLKLEEAKLRFSSGLISGEELDKAKWELNKLKYEKVILLLDVMSAKEELEKLNLIRGLQGS